MADFLYGKGRQKFLEGSIAWLTDNIKALLADSAFYTPTQNTDEYKSDISGSAIPTNGVSGNFANKTSTLGVADADDVVLTSVTGAQSEYIVIYKDTGTAATSPLIAKIDSYTGLPVTPNGGNITIQFPSDSNRIFRL